MTDILLAMLCPVILTYLFALGEKVDLQQRRGWRYILAGFALIFFGILVGIADKFPVLDEYMVIGGTDYQAILEKVVGYLFGFFLLAIGFWKWIPAIVALQEARSKLEESYDELEMQVNNHTKELHESRNELEMKVAGKTASLESLNERLRQETADLKRTEEALREDVEKYQGMVERTDNGVCIIQDGLLKYANPHVSLIIGYPTEEIVDTALLDHIHPDKVAEFRDRADRIAQGEDIPSIYESAFLCQDGRKVDVEISAGVTSFEKKAAEFIVIRGISDRKQMEQKLEAQHQQIREHSFKLEATREELQDIQQQFLEANCKLQDGDLEFEAVFEHTSDGIFYLDTHGTITDMNGRAGEIFGYRHDDVIGKSFVEIGLLEMESLPIMPEMLQGSIRISHLEAVEAKRKDGSEAVVDVYLSLIENGGKLKGILVTMKDITKYTEAEESLRVSRAEMDLWMEERAEKLAKIEKDLQTQISERKKIEDSMTELKARWRSLEESAVNIIMIVNRDGKIISMNRMMADALPQQTMGQKVYDYLAPEYHQVMSTAINRVFTFGAPEGCQFIGLGPDSGYSSYEARLGPIRSDGQISAVLLIINDITERMGAEESLKEAEQRFRDLANMLPQTVFEIDLNGNFTFANNFGLQYTGYIQDDIDKGLNALQLFAPEDRGRVLWNIERALTGQEFGSHEYTALRKDESTFRVMAHTSPIIRNGKIVGMRGIILDITDRIQAEEEIRIKNEELVAVHAELQELNQNLEAKVNERTSEVKNLLKNKEDFISQLGHDLRSPMMPLVGLLPMIQERETDAESKELLGVIAENVEFMSNLIEETLALASLDSLDVGFNTCDVKLSEVLSDLIVRKQNACEQNGIAVENTVGDEVTVAVNKQRLDEVLDKLISNAIKFTPDGGTLTFAARKDGEFVTVSARDTGIGLTDEQAVHVFEEFYKADESRHQLGAPGLGLTICERIVRKHGGEIWVESEGLGKGTTVYFTIPIATDRSE